MKLQETYKKRFRLLLVGSLAFLIITYNLAFKKSIMELNSVKVKKMNLSYLQNAPDQLQLLHKKLGSLESISGKDIKNENWMEVAILSKATEIIQGSALKIVELPHSHFYSKDGFTVKTQQIVIQGAFFELLSFLHSLENENSLGKLCSVEFYSHNDIKTKINKLNMRIFIQTILQN